MRFLLLSARKDLLRIRRDPFGLLTWLGIPMLIGLLMVTIFGRSGQSRAPQGLLLIADLDNSFLSSFVPRMYTQGSLGQMLTIQQTPIEEGRRKIGAGEASALLVIPKGFGAAVLRNDKIQLELVTNPAQTILPAIIQETTAVLVDGVWYLQQALGNDLRQFTALTGAPTDAQISAGSVGIGRRINALGRYLDPPLIQLDTQVIAAKPGPSFDMASAMFPIMVFMAVIFLAFGHGADIWKEKGQGTLRRLAVTPASVGGFLGGKLLALGAVYALLGIAAQIAGAFFLPRAPHQPVLAVVWVAATGCGFYLLLLLVTSLVNSERAATTLGNFVVMILAMVGGCFFPFEAMPAFLARIGRLTPNGWAVSRYKEIVTGQTNVLALAPALASMAAAIAAMYLLAWWRTRRKFMA